MKQELNAIHKFYRTGQNRVSLNKTWERIHFQLGIGKIAGRFLEINATERNHLLAWIQSQTGVDARVSSELPQTRLDMAAQASDEKLAKSGVFENLVKVAGVRGLPFQTKGGTAQAPRGGYVEVDINDLDLPNLTVIIVENGSLIRHWETILLPADIVDGLFIYRGHDDSLKSLHTALERNRPSQLIGYYDIDPAGLSMALERKVDSVLVPKDLQSLLANQSLQKSLKSDAFWKQYEILQRLQVDLSLSPSSRMLVDLIAEHQVALTQEHCSTHSLQLVEWPLIENH